MKKIIRTLSLILAFAILCSFALVSCKNEETEKEPGKKEEGGEGYDPYPYSDLSVYIDLPDYKNLTVKQSAIEAAIDEQIEYGIEANDLYEEVTESRAAALGDKTIIDFIGFLDDQPFDGGTGNDYPLVLGSGKFVPGFEEGIVGMKVGDVKDVSLTFPTNYYEALAGKDVVFSVTLKGIYEKPEINDDFAKNYSNYETLADLRAAIGADMKLSLAWDILSSGVKMKEVPDEYAAYYQDYVQYFTDYATQYEMTLENFVYTYGSQFSDSGLYSGMSLTDFYKAAEEYAYFSTLSDLIVFSVLRADGVTKDGERYNSAKALYLANYPDKTYDELVTMYGEESVVTSIFGTIFNEILKRNVTVENDIPQ